MIRNRRTLMVPERLNIMTLKNVAADDTLWPWNDDHRVTETGRTIREYAMG
jgi:lipopolysaccharide/colanic/teichoic acid biosynthesis glycosyltransferase